MIIFLDGKYLIRRNYHRTRSNNKADLPLREKVQLLFHMAKCHQQLKNFSRVNRLATSAIDLYASAALSENRGTDTLNKDDSDQLAALYSIRSVAQEENEKISDAVTDLERAMNLSEAVRHGSAYRQRLTRLKTLLQRIQTEDRSGEFTDYYRTIYRLHIVRNPPSTAALNTPYRVDFRLTNEFGLFKYEEISQHVGSLPMQMTVLDRHGRALNSQVLEVRVVGEDRAEINARGRASFMIALNPGQDYTPNEAYYVAFSVLGALKDYVIPVLTAPLTVTSHAAESQEEVVPDPYEYRLFPVKGKHVMLKEQICEIAGKVWDCALLLIRFFEREQISFTGKRVVDIGSGTGIMGLACRQLGANHVMLTDLDKAQDLLRANIALNQAPNEGEHVIAHRLFWGDQTQAQALNPPVDLIVATDVIYEYKFLEPLIQTLTHLSGPNTVIYLAYRSRGLTPEQEKEAFAKLKETFTVQQTQYVEKDFLNISIWVLTAK
jgi:predicted nicotinamide N-methyase